MAFSDQQLLDELSRVSFIGASELALIPSEPLATARRALTACWPTASPGCCATARPTCLPTTEAGLTSTMLVAPVDEPHLAYSSIV